MNQSVSEFEVCPVCNTGSLIVSYFAAPLDYSSNQRFPIVACSHCGYGKTGDVQVHLDNLYVGGFYDVKEKLWHKLSKPLLSLLEREKLRYLKADKKGAKKLLEIGCGKGRFLDAARKAGIQVFGIEPSPRSFTFASERLGNSVAPIELDEIDDWPMFPGKFDYVMLWHVFEHLNEPGKVLSKIKEKLEPQGRVVLAVPNFASHQARLGKADWYHLDPPRHIHHFTPQSIRILADAGGFEVENIFFNSFYQNFTGEITTLVNKLFPGKNVVFNGLRNNRAYFELFGPWGWVMFILGSALSLLIFPLVLLLTMFNQLTGRSGTMVVILKVARSPTLKFLQHSFKDMPKKIFPRSRLVRD